MIQIDVLQKDDFPHFLEHLLKWGEQFVYQAILNSNGYEDQYGKFELLAAFGDERLLESNSFEELKQFVEAEKSWLFGHFSYDLKNKLERLESRNTPRFSFADISFFQPSILFKQARNSKEIEVYLANSSYEKVYQTFQQELTSTAIEKDQFEFPTLIPRQTKSEYIHAFEQLKKEIQYGNIYEINYCQEFFAEDISLNPALCYQLLNHKSAMPYSAYYRNNQSHLICASPERFICKRGSTIYSQPIKGTAKRGFRQEEDHAIIEELRGSLKEQTENVMIVDLVRNDLSRTAKKGSVEVEELFGVYSFPQVHQLISTVKSELSDLYHFTDAIKHAFPMGSMTGAPKISAMKLTDHYEESRRELYSGSVGYIDPAGDFDFNVVIRSLLYSSEKKYLSLTVGGAITDLSDPESEYEECLLKAKAIFELQNNS